MKWEYAVAVGSQGMSTQTVERLNALGADGWELVAVCSDTFYFKRKTDEIKTLDEILNALEKNIEAERTRRAVQTDAPTLDGSPPDS